MSGAWLRWANWIISGLLAICAVGTAAATGLGWSIAGVLAVGSAAVTQLEKLLNQLQKALRHQQQERTRRERYLRSLLVTGRLLRVEEADPYLLGVRRSRSAETSLKAKGKRPPPYVSRVHDGVDQKLRGYLRQREPFVLLIGESRAGKSRTAFEAAISQEAGLRRNLLIAPVRFGIKSDSLSRIFAILRLAELGQPPTLLWLDDLHHYLDAGALTASLLAAWREQDPRIIVLATIRSGEYNRLRFSGSRGSTNKESEILEQASSVLEQAELVELPVELSRDEIAEAEDLYPGHDWTRAGIGEELVLAPAMLDKFLTAADDNSALVKAAVDWERAGLTRPISKSQLAELWQTYGRRQRPSMTSPDRFEAALKWATTFLEDSDSALVYAMEGGYDADDYVVAHREALHEIPAATWQCVIRAVSPEEAYSVGLAAYSRGELEVSIQAWQRASDEAAPPTAARALVNKAIVLGEQRQSEQAIAVLQEVERLLGRSQEPALQAELARALVNRGAVLGKRGRLEQEITAYEEVERRFGESQEPALRVWLARALVNKGAVLGKRGRLEQEIAAYQEVERRFGESQELPVQAQFARALVNRGLALSNQRQLEQAIAVFEEVERRFDQAQEPVLQEPLARALVNKGTLLGSQRQLEQAIAVFEEVERRFGKAQAPALQEPLAVALVHKGFALGDQGQVGQAIAVFEEVERRFGEGKEPAREERLTRALSNKGVGFGERGRSAQEIAAYEEVERRFGSTQEPALKLLLARARRYWAELEGEEFEGEEFEEGEFE